MFELVTGTAEVIYPCTKFSIRARSYPYVHVNGRDQTVYSAKLSIRVNGRDQTVYTAKLSIRVNGSDQTVHLNIGEIHTYVNISILSFMI